MKVLMEAAENEQYIGSVSLAPALRILVEAMEEIRDQEIVHNALAAAAEEVKR